MNTINSEKLKEFDYIHPESVDEVEEALGRYKEKAKILAGGTNLIPALRWNILSSYPEVVVDISGTIDLRPIKEDADGLKVGALSTLSELSKNKTIKEKYKILADAAHLSGPPQTGNLATIAGDISRELSSWYLWNPNSRVRDLDAEYIATDGMNQYLSIFGGAEVGYAVNISNVAVALTALNATIITSKRQIPIGEFYGKERNFTSNTVIEPDEIIIEIRVPKPEAGTKQIFNKLSIRKAIDSPLVSVAVVASLSGKTVNKCKIVLGAVAPEPWEASEAENYVEGKELTKDVAEKAAEEAVANAEPLTKNDYKVQMAKTLVKRGLLDLV